MPTPGKSVVWGLDRQHLAPPHFHGQLELVLLRRGHARILLGTEQFDLQPYTVVWILPGVTHFMFDFSADAELWIVGFEPEHVQSLAVGSLGWGAPSPFSGWLLKVARAGSVVRLNDQAFEHLYQFCHQQSLVQGQGLTPAGLDDVFRTALLATAEALNPHYSLSLAFHASCLAAEDPGLSREDLCKALDVSPSYLAREFKRELGTGFAQYRSRIRISSFLAFTRQGSSLLSAGLAAGFGSYSQLYRTFSQVTDWKPRDYVEREGRTVSDRVTHCQVTADRLHAIDFMPSMSSAPQPSITSNRRRQRL